MILARANIAGQINVYKFGTIIFSVALIAVQFSWNYIFAEHWVIFIYNMTAIYKG